MRQTYQFCCWVYLFVFEMNICYSETTFSVSHEETTATPSPTSTPAHADVPSTRTTSKFLSWESCFLLPCKDISKPNRHSDSKKQEILINIGSGNVLLPKPLLMVHWTPRDICNEISFLCLIFSCDPYDISYFKITGAVILFGNSVMHITCIIQSKCNFF